MHYLITGGAGFIGNALALRLLGEGHKVTIIDNVNDYYDRSLKEARLARLPVDVKVHKVDISDRTALESVFKSQSFDGICHLAAQAGVRYSLTHPEVYVQTNYVGTFNIFDLAKLHDISKIVFASTSSVYGASTDMPFTEDDPVMTQLSIYAATKRGCELLAANYNHLYGTSITCLRFFTVYGPWGRPDMALFLFTDKILKGEPIDVFNDGNMRRDFTYIDDIVEGFVRALTMVEGYNIINLGCGRPVQLMDFISTLEKELGKKATIHFKPLQPGDVPETFASTKKAEQLLGFVPQTTTEVGVSNFVKWHREFFGN